MNETIRSLRDFGTGSFGAIADIRIEPSAAKRLADMGFVRGVRVQMIQPGSPCVVRLDDVRVGLGVAYQRGIWLQPLPETNAQAAE